MVSLRVHTGDDASGYLFVEADGEDVGGIGPRYVAVHRLAALAWGEIDALDDPREIHHRDGAPSHNAESNLQALDSREHGRVTRQQARQRRALD